jgi:redox-sensitive bicupin YhaK (pirin superfamily)
VNLPAKDKTAAPGYQPITAAQIPRVERPAGAGAVRVIAGAYGEARGPAHVLILAGEPIDEPIVQYGPFVMNSVDEIRQAITDVNQGRFGPVPE